jgi:hypothetical protein
MFYTLQRMSSLFTILLIISLVGLTWGMIAPSHLAKTAKVKTPVTRLHTGLIFGFLVLVCLVLVGTTTPSQTPSKVQQSNLTLTPSKPQTPAATNTVTTKQVTETQPIAFTTSDQNDSNLPKGQTKVIQSGKNGVETLTYTVTYTNGKQTAKSLTKTTISTPSVNQVVEVGTYVAPTTAPVTLHCTSGSYVNVNGVAVCSPETSASAPAGATAQCKDGTYSFSLHHSGTCSSHGGVAVWL